MRVISFNVRGVGIERVKKKVVKEIMAKEQIQFLRLQDTKWNKLNQVCVNTCGGILMFNGRKT